MVSRDIRCVVPAGDRCGEGALWSDEERAVYWTDINRFLIHRLDEASGAVHSWFFDRPVVALSLTTRTDTLLVALGSHLILWQPETDSRRELGFHLPGWPEVRLNDGRTDPLGNFWVGSMKNNVGPDGEPGEPGFGLGVLYRITPQGEVSVWRRDLGIANTLCWSPDQRTFYFADTLADTICAYDYDAADASIANERAFLVEPGPGVPDGSAIDAEGHLWNCRYGGGCVLRVAPSGELVETIAMPVANITTAVFGGSDRRQLFITSAAHGPLCGERLAGGLFRLESDVPGLPPNRFRIG